MRRFITFIIATALAGAALVAPAHAAPPNTMGLDELRTLLANNPSGVPGYFLTVPGGPSAAQQIPVQVKMTVLAVADKTGPDGALIMFKADLTDPVMQNIGTIAMGMSGSPLYLNAGDKLIGALSYGDDFTLDGLGLATPIEYMIATQGDFPPAAAGTFTLDRAVRLDGRTVRKVAITDESVAADTIAVQPLLRLRVTGVPQSSAVYRRFERVANAKGVQLLPGGSGQCTQSGFSSPYVGGGSLGAYYTLGSAEVGGYGTVTYVDGATVMGFGHPMDWTGKTDIFATNVWIAGIWGSSLASYKVGCAGQIRGALTQDRSAAVGVDLNATTVSTPVTSNVSITTNATRSGAGDTKVAAGTFTAGYGPQAVALGVSEPVYRVANQAAMAGSAVTTTTVRVADSTGSYTVTRPDVWSSADVLGDASLDAGIMTEILLSVPGLGARIESAHLEATIDQNSRSATISSVRGGPLQAGQNTLTAVLKPTGKPAVEIPLTFTVPPNVSLDQGIAVEAGSTYTGGDTFSIPSFDSLAGIVEWLNKVPTNNQLVISMPDASGNPVEVARIATDYYLDGAVYPSSASGQLVADLPEAVLGDQVNLLAMPMGAPNGAPITLQQRVAGAADWQTVGTAPLTAGSDGLTAAAFLVTPEANTSYRTSWSGNADYLAWSAGTDVTVAPPLSIDGTRRGDAWLLSLTSAPQMAGQIVSVQAKRNGSWRQVGQATLAADGSASVRWKTGPATVKVRAAAAATPRFVAVTSSPVTLTSSSLIVDTAATPTRKGNITVALRDDKGRPITGVRYRIARSTDSGWEPAASGSLRRTTRLWLANGDYRVTVPKQKGVPAQVRERPSVTGAMVLIRRAEGGRGRASVSAAPPIPLRFTVQKLQAGQWLPVGGVRRMRPPSMAWSGPLSPGRYRFSFVKQNGFGGTVSEPVRVR
jgi:hypothetical protein